MESQRPSTPPPSGEWPAQAADTIVNAVGAVRDRTTGPIMSLARGLVTGVFVVALGGMIAVLALIGVIRFLDRVLPWGIWLPYLLLGVIFTVAGLLVFRRRNQSSATPPSPR